MSERETADVIWAVKETASRAGAHSEGYEGMPYATKYIRADIAEQREAELAALLSEAIKALPVNHETYIRARELLDKSEARVRVEAVVRCLGPYTDD